MKLRLGRERLADDIAGIRAVRNAVGEDIKVMVDFNQGLTSATRCTAATASTIRAYWLGEPIAYDNLAG